MKRRVRQIVLLVAVLCLFSTSSALAQTYTSRHVSGNLYLMNVAYDSVETMNNLVLLGPEGTLLVDTTEAGAYASFRAGLDQISREPVHTLINTHWHHDHTGLNADFVTQEGTQTILAHFRTGTLLKTDQVLPDLQTTSPALPPEAQPTEEVRFGKLLVQNGETVLVLPTPPNAHSNTDLIVFFLRSNVIYLGDIYFGGSFPFIDRANGGSIDGMILTCKLILPLASAQTLLVPSHGPAGDRQGLVAYTNMLETVRDRIQSLIDQGLDEEQAIATNPLGDLDPEWGGFFLTAEQFARLVYRDLAE